MENNEEKLAAEGQLPDVQEVKPEVEDHEQVTEKSPPDSGTPPKRRKSIILFGAIGMVVLIGAALFYFLYLGHPSRQAVAKVNGEIITVEQFHRELAKVEEPLREMLKEEPQQFLEGMVVKMLLLQEAKKEGLTAPVKTYKDKEALPAEEALIADLMKKKFSSPPAVTREEIEAFYSMFKEQMKGGTLNQMSPVIEQIIREGKQREQMEQFMKDLHGKAKIEIDEGRLKKMAAIPPESNTEEEFKKAMTSGKPVLVDFGANSCLPCRQIRPILKEVGKEYSEKARVLVIDVYKFQDLAKQFKVQLIPTLVFFDSKGKEAFRHLGVLDKEKIVAKLKEIGMES
jgi:thioredoxin 1